MHKRYGFPSIVLGVMVAACATATEPDRLWEIDYGVLMPGMFSGVLVIPDTVVVGRAVPVTVITIGSSSCVRPGAVVIEGAGTRLQTLTPRDSIAVRGTACTDDLASRPHPAVLTFQEPGSATVRVQGYFLERDMTRRLGTVDRQIIVRP